MVPTRLPAFRSTKPPAEPIRSVDKYGIETITWSTPAHWFEDKDYYILQMSHSIPKNVIFTALFIEVVIEFVAYFGTDLYKFRKTYTKIISNNTTESFTEPMLEEAKLNLGADDSCLWLVSLKRVAFHSPEEAYIFMQAYTTESLPLTLSTSGTVFAEGESRREDDENRVEYGDVQLNADLMAFTEESSASMRVSTTRVRESREPDYKRRYHYYCGSKIVDLSASRLIHSMSVHKPQAPTVIPPGYTVTKWNEYFNKVLSRDINLDGLIGDMCIQITGTWSDGSPLKFQLYFPSAHTYSVSCRYYNYFIPTEECPVGFFSIGSCIHSHNCNSSIYQRHDKDGETNLNVTLIEYYEILPMN